MPRERKREKDESAIEKEREKAYPSVLINTSHSVYPTVIDIKPINVI